MATGGGTKKSTGKSPTKSKTKKPKKPLHRPSNPRQDLTQLITLIVSTTSAAHSFLTQSSLHLLPSQTLSLESHLSSTSLSLSKLLSLVHPFALSHPSPPPPLPSSSDSSPPPCWFSRFLSAAASNYDPRWVENFRMSKPTFSLLLRLLTPSLNSLSPIPPNYALAAALFRLAHGAAYKSVGRRFGLDSATACRAFYVVCKGINEKLGHLFEFKSDINRVIVGFGWISLPNCCGVLGFHRFPVGGDLMGENGSVIVQAVVDSEGRFLDVSAGWPGSMKPDLIFHQSGLFSGVEVLGEFLNGPSYELSNGNSIPQYLLGDSCLPLLPWLLTPFVELNYNNINLDSSKQAFNSVHNVGMEFVDMAFGRIWANWQLISKEWKEESIESFPFIIVACCLLHNFLIKCSEAFPDKNVRFSRDHELPVFEGEVDESARRIRDALASHLSRVSQRK